MAENTGGCVKTLFRPEAAERRVVDFRILELFFAEIIAKNFEIAGRKKFWNATEPFLNNLTVSPVKRASAEAAETARPANIAFGAVKETSGSRRGAKRDWSD